MFCRLHHWLQQISNYNKGKSLKSTTFYILGISWINRELLIKKQEGGKLTYKRNLVFKRLNSLTTVLLQFTLNFWYVMANVEVSNLRLNLLIYRISSRNCSVLQNHSFLVTFDICRCSSKQFYIWWCLKK